MEPQTQMQTVTGIWTKDSIDVYTIGELERVRSDFSMNLNENNRLQDLIQQFLSITSKMEEMIQKSFWRDDYKAIREFKIKLWDKEKEPSYNWYDLKANYEFFTDTVEELRFLWEKMSSIYQHFLLLLKIGIATETLDPKRRSNL